MAVGFAGRHVRPRRSRWLLFAALMAAGVTGGAVGPLPAHAAGTVTFGTFKTIPGTLLPSNLTRFGSQVVFTADSDRVMITDGETAHVLRDFSPRSCGAPGPHDLTAFKSSILFGGGQTDDELWQTNGTATAFVRNIDPAHAGASECPVHSHPAGFATLGGWSLFAATVRSGSGRELWRTNGTTAGTGLVRNIAPGTLSSAPTQITPWTSYAYFAATTPSAGREIWKTNGTAAGTWMVRNIRPGRGSSGPTWITLAGGKMFFTANDGPHGRELWRTNGTAAGTVLVRDIAPGPASSTPNHLVAAGGALYFLANDGTHGQQLWKSDGTAAGTVMVKNLGAGSKNVSSLAAVGDRLYFGASTPGQGNALWTSLGTAATTHSVVAVGVGGNTIANVDGMAMFAGNDGTHGLEPWVSDGTTSGTHMLDDVWPGSESSLPRQFTYAGGRVYFLDSYDAYLWTATVS